MNKWENPELKSIGLALTKGNGNDNHVCPDCLVDYQNSDRLAAHRQTTPSEIKPGQNYYGGCCPTKGTCPAS